MAKSSMALSVDVMRSLEIKIKLFNSILERLENRKEYHHTFGAGCIGCSGSCAGSCAGGCSGACAGSCTGCTGGCSGDTGIF